MFPPDPIKNKNPGKYKLGHAHDELGKRECRNQQRQPEKEQPGDDLIGPHSFDSYGGENKKF
jgi:hypothetical protein